MRSPELALLLILGALALPAAAAQSAPTSRPNIRYHYGDYPAWANTQFDDSTWPEAQSGSFPAPGYGSGGFFWVRARVAVPAAPGPFAIELQTVDRFPNVQEVWVNDCLLGRYGGFPPLAKPLVHPQKLVFDIPAGIVKPGSVAVIALRTWDTPDDWSESLVLRHPDPVSVVFSIDNSSLLRSLASEAQDRAWLRFWPQMSLELVFVMLGLAVLAFGIWTRDRTLLLCALWLVVLPAFLAFYPLVPLFVGVDLRLIYTAFLIVNAIGMYVVVEFIWTVQGLHDRIVRSASHLCWIGLTITEIFSTNRTQPGVPVFVGMLAGNWFLFAFNVTTSGANLFALTGRGRNRPVAAAMLLISVGYFLQISGHPFNFGWGGIDFFTAAFYLSTLFIAVLLMRQTWTAWRKAEDLRIEFAAAREVQQRLVPAVLPRIDGLRIEAAYLPAQEVGGDFYQVFVQSDSSALVVIGDVSGKGLKAAMTGTLALGALGNLAQDDLSPSRMLTRLNRQLAASSDGGFVTCLVARLARSGALTLANAGHLAPYRNGEEIPLGSGLPLGITPNTTYAESTLTLVPNDHLTFLSDGIVEAQSATGELFGFDRARSISTQPAESIAGAAQRFGQQDDITVLTLTFVPAQKSAEVVHA